MTQSVVAYRNPKDAPGGKRRIFSVILLWICSIRREAFEEQRSEMVRLSIRREPILGNPYSIIFVIL